MVGNRLSDQTMSVSQRLIGLCNALGIRKAHFAATLEDDWCELAVTHPEVVGSLSLVCPNAAIPDALGHLACPVRILHGEDANGLESLREAVAREPGVCLDLLTGFEGLLWSDVAAEHPQGVVRTILEATADSRIADVQKGLSAEGEVHGITYRIRGDGPPLFLFPLALAPSQWDPVIDMLAEHFTVIVLGGSEVGIAARLEARGRCIGYRETVIRALERANVRRARRIIDVGCGTGIATRLIASCCTGRAQITAVDVNRYLLHEARILADRDGLGGVVEFRSANAERLGFPNDIFHLSFSMTVLEEVTADDMLSEMVRVTRPDGRVAVVIRAVDIPRIVNAPLSEDLKHYVETDPKFTAGASALGCADTDLYRRFVRAGLEDVQIFPQLITYREPGRIDQLSRVIEANLDPEDRRAWCQAVETAKGDGTFFIAMPMHCAIGRVPNAEGV